MSQAPSSALNAGTRRRALEALRSETFDILVIGGGITGAGIARDAALRGYRVALVEKADFAAGTSSTSTKLAHGGLRYLENYDFSLVFEALRERRVLMEIAPHLVRPLQLLFPLYRGGYPSPLKLWAGLTLYDLLALGRNIGRHRMVGRQEALERAAGLRDGRLLGAGLFYDCWAHDSGLVIATLRSAAAAGAWVASYTRAEVTGRGRVRLTDVLDGDHLEARCRLVVSATGPWTDEILGDGHLQPSKGIHLTFSRSRLPLRQAMLTIHPRDRRVIFIIPWGSHVYSGTTETAFEGDPDRVTVEPADVDYILEGVNFTFPEARLTPEDVTGSWAGLRPLLGSDAGGTYRSSREHSIWEPEPGLLAIAGGKLTTYRVMARQCVDAAARILSRDHGRQVAPPVDTGRRPLPGGEPGWDAPLNGDLPADAQRHLVERYGSEAAWVASLPGRGRLVAGLPEIEAEVRHAVRREMALRLPDFLVRRTQLASRELQGSVTAAERVAKIMAEELGWSEARRREELEAYRGWARAYRAAPAALRGSRMRHRPS